MGDRQELCDTACDGEAVGIAISQGGRYPMQRNSQATARVMFTTTVINSWNIFQTNETIVSTKESIASKNLASEGDAPEAYAGTWKHRQKAKIMANKRLFKLLHPQLFVKLFFIANNYQVTETWDRKMLFSLSTCAILA